MEIAIFGAGVGGLTAAHKLATTDIPFRITIYEQKPVAGGLVRSEGPPVVLAKFRGGYISIFTITCHL